MTGEPAPPPVGAFDGRLVPGRRVALLIVDVVIAYLEPASPLYAGVEAALASNERLLAAARAAGTPVVITNVTYRHDGIDGGLFFRKIPAPPRSMRSATASCRSWCAMHAATAMKPPTPPASSIYKRNTLRSFRNTKLHASWDVELITHHCTAVSSTHWQVVGGLTYSCRSV